MVSIICTYGVSNWWQPGYGIYNFSIRFDSIQFHIHSTLFKTPTTSFYYFLDWLTDSKERKNYNYNYYITENEKKNLVQFYVPYRTLLENCIPHHQPRTQPHCPPKHQLRRAPPLRRPLQLPVAPGDVLRGGRRVGDQLADVLLLCGQVADEGLLEGGDFEEGFFGVPGGKQ